ncbi:hypothetical protein [Streptomyces sp. UNOC14_S4]|nr:hypothetical protein [Streptomyces sp. UNOC14_S4]MCC3771728.1 hypothetical protein [Streptomyces sp. UNOC14_S4]
MDNKTDSIARLFRDDSCTVLQDTLLPNGSGAYGGATVPHSVQFSHP